MSAIATAVPPLPGSIHYFAELYAPAPRRALLRAVHALEAEVRASLKAELDHGVAHVRLEWWAQEAERTAAGAPAHPLVAELGTYAGAAPLGAALSDWVLAARAELAGDLLAPEVRAVHAAHAVAARFALIAALLGADPAAARAAARTDVEALAAAPQAPLRPLLVWTMLELARARRGDPAPPERPATTRRGTFGDNWHAWRAARAADAGRAHQLLRKLQP